MKKAAKTLPPRNQNPKMSARDILLEKHADRMRARRHKKKGLPTPSTKKNVGTKRKVVVKNRSALENIKEQARRVRGEFTDPRFKDILRAKDLQARNNGSKVTETKEHFSDRFAKMTTFTSENPRHTSGAEWTALCIYTNLSSEFHAVAMFDSTCLAARLMGFTQSCIQRALDSESKMTPSEKLSGRKDNFSGTSGVINKDDVCHWRYVKRQ